MSTGFLNGGNQTLPRWHRQEREGEDGLPRRTAKTALPGKSPGHGRGVQSGTHDPEPGEDSFLKTDPLSRFAEIKEKGGRNIRPAAIPNYQ